MANLTPATGLVILLKFDSNRWFFSPCEMEIRRMTSKNNRAPPFGYIKLCALFQSHHWIQTVVIVRNRLFPVKIGDFWSRMTYKIWRMTLKAMGQFFYATSSCVYHFVVLPASCSMESMVRWVNCNGRASRHEINNYNANADVFLWDWHTCFHLLWYLVHAQWCLRVHAWD